MTGPTCTAVLDRLGEIRIVPVVVIDDADRAADLMAALSVGGIGCAEITLRTPAGLTALAAAAGAAPDLLVGAGTVLTVDQVDRAVDAGARFLVSPGFDDEVVERAAHHGVLILPGVATPTEVQRGLRAGLDHLKLYPAGVLGGLRALDALAGPFPAVRFLPSGGVTPANATEFLAHPAVFAISGSWMVPRSMVAAGDFGAIEQLSRGAAGLVAGSAR